MTTEIYQGDKLGMIYRKGEGNWYSKLFDSQKEANAFRDEFQINEYTNFEKINIDAYLIIADVVTKLDSKEKPDLSSFINLINSTQLTSSQ